MFKTNILTTKIPTMLRLLSALVFISPMGVTANRSYIFNKPNFNAFCSIVVVLGCIGGFRYFFTTKEESSRTKRVLLFYVLPAVIGVGVFVFLNSFDVEDYESRIKNYESRIKKLQTSLQLARTNNYKLSNTISFIESFLTSEADLMYRITLYYDQCYYNQCIRPRAYSI